MLVPSYATQEEIPEGLKEHYEEKEGAWVPQGFVSKSKLDEFRNTNISLAKEQETLKAQLLKVKDIDPVIYADTVKKLQELENTRLEQASEWGVLKANLAQQHSDEMKIEKEGSAKIQAGWNAEKVGNAVAMTVSKYAMPAEGNMPYIQDDIKKIASIDPDTNEIVFLNDKKLPKKNEAGDGNLTLDEYLTKIYIPKSNLFRKSEGSGSLGGHDVPLINAGQVSVNDVSGKDISGDMIKKLANGEIKAI